MPFGIESNRSEVKLTNQSDIQAVVGCTGSLADNVARIALDIGEGMLKCDAEVHRVEIAIEKVCRAYGARHVDVFSIQSLIIAAVYMSDGSHSTQSRRVFSNSTNLSRIEDYNALSRKICENPMPIREVDEEIRKIKNKSAYPFLLTILGNMLGSGSFAIFFGGTLMDGIATAIAGIVVALLSAINFDNFNKMIKTMLTSFVAGLFSCLLIRLGLGDNLDMILIGVIMLMIPGISLGNAMRDLVCGDTLTGSSRIVQAVIIALMIALGLAPALIIAGGGI